MKMFPVQEFKYEEIGTSITQKQVTVKDSSVLLVGSDINAKLVIIRNEGTDSLYIGSQSVSTSDGFELRDREAIGIAGYKGDIYAISSGKSDVRVMIFR